MSTEVETTSEPLWRVIASWQMLLAAVCGIVFYLSITRVSMDSIPPEMTSAHNDERFATMQLFDTINALPPMVLYLKGDKEQAAAEALKKVKEHPWDAMNLLCAGNILSDSVATADEGFRMLRKAIYMAPTSRYVRLFYARKLVQGNRLEEAITQYDLLANHYNLWTQPRYELADLYMNQKDWSDAAHSLDEALHNDSQNGPARIKLGIAMAANSEADGFEEFKKGVSLEQVDDDRNSAQLQKDLATVRSDVSAKPDDQQLKLKEARLLIAAKVYSEARNTLSQLIDQNKENPEPYVLMAQLECLSNDLTTARTDFNKAVQLIQNRPST